MNLSFLKSEERIALALKSLYKSFGYAEYKLSSFEEYALYAENVRFLPEREVIAFQADGKLLALRPDVTLSVAKNLSPVGTSKLFYDETVYRKSADGFSEVRQIGVEIVGRVDGVARAELCALALGTMNAVGRKFVLDVSHVGVVEKLLDWAGLDEAGKAFARNCMVSKNAHDFARYCQSAGCLTDGARALLTLINLPARPAEGLEKLKEIGKRVDLSAEIAELEEFASLADGQVNVDFSIGGDADYYNGVIFKGYIEGVPRAVLSGGRYDNLLSKFGKKAQAVGFALYLGELGACLHEPPQTAEVAVLYNDENGRRALERAEGLRRAGKRTLVCRTLPPDFSGEVVRAEEDYD